MKTDPANRNSRSKNALLVVAKRPQPGETKTRLTPPLSDEQASLLYEHFLKDTLVLVRQVVGVQPVLAYLPANGETYFCSIAPDFERLLQTGSNLGERLDHALTHYLERGFQKAVIMDSDSPTLPVCYLEAAFDVLDDGADVALGPCEDGGYYLIGLKRPAPRLLREVQMSTPNVTADTLALADKLRLKVTLLPEWYDVDDATALMRLNKELMVAPPGIAIHTREFIRQLPLRDPK